MVREPIAAIIRRHISAGQVLSTPGRGLPPSGQNPFRIARVDDSRVVFRFPSGEISVPFSEIEHAIAEVRKAGGRVRLGGSQGWADPGTLQRFLQDAKGNQLRTVTYIAPVLAECGIAEYTMEGGAKGIQLVDSDAPTQTSVLMADYSELDQFSALVKREMDAMQEHTVGMNNCVSCKYWSPGEDLIRKVSFGGPNDDIALAGGLGSCHRFPPRGTRRDYNVDAGFPATIVDDWCGEWAKRENSVIY